MSIITREDLAAIVSDPDDLAFLVKRFDKWSAAYEEAKAFADARDNAEEAAFNAWLSDEGTGADEFKSNRAKIERLTAELDRLTEANDELWSAVSDQYVGKVAEGVSGSGADVTTALRTTAGDLKKIIGMTTDGLPDGVTIPSRVGKSGGTGTRQVGGMGKPWLARIVLDGTDVEPSGDNPTLTDLSSKLNVSTKVLSDALYEANGQVRDVPESGTGVLHVTVNDTPHEVVLFARPRGKSTDNES